MGGRIKISRATSVCFKNLTKKCPRPANIDR